MEFDINIGLHMTSGRLQIGKQCTNGILELRNLLFRLFASLESAVAVHGVAGLCILYKSCDGNVCAVPYIPPSKAALMKAGSIFCVCHPDVNCLNGSSMNAYGWFENATVPIADTSEWLARYAFGGSELALSSCASFGVLHVFGDAQSPAAAGVSLASAVLHKWISGLLKESPTCRAGLSEKKYASGNMLTTLWQTEASGYVAWYRKLCEVDPMTLEEMDDMSLEELDYVVDM